MSSIFLDFQIHKIKSFSLFLLVFLVSASVFFSPKVVAENETNWISTGYALPYKAGKALRVTQGYNGWFSHRDILEKSLDFGAYSFDATGTPILAAKAGKVIAVREGGNYNKTCRNIISCKLKEMNGLPKNDYWYTNGNMVVIDHGDGETSNYYHLNPGSISVSYGDYVDQGEQIGELGDTGYSTQAHLHFHVWKNGTEPVDVKFLECGCSLVQNGIYTSGNWR
jgi:murein DD-endopeptidase MepM/ murein hydrolase activator NlpD